MRVGTGLGHVGLGPVGALQGTIYMEPDAIDVDSLGAWMVA